MAKLPGLTLRGGVYQLRVMVPLNLRPHYGRDRIRETLGTSDYREACLKATIRRAELLSEFRHKATGKPLEGVPVVAPVEASGCLLRLRQVFTRWKAAKARTDDSVASMERALLLYETHTENPPLGQLRRADGDAFRAKLLTLGAASKTSRDRLNYVKTLLNYAARDLELIPRNPWEGLDIEFKTAKKRKPWTDAQVAALLAQPLYTLHVLPTQWNAGKEAAYWLPLLGLYTGARIGELVQLRPGDVDPQHALPMLTITDEDDKRVKTAAAVRRIPLHSELVRLGFLQYAQRMKQRSTLWPDLRLSPKKPAAYFSNWFGDYRKGLGFPDLHSMRHTVRSRLANAGIQAELIDALIGHSAKGSTGSRVYTHWDSTALRHAIEKIKYSRRPII
jgi:integrase